MTPNEDVVEDSPSKLKLGERKSISDTFSRFTTNTFSRRRTTTNVPASTSSNASNFRSRLPTPSGIPRGSSLFGGLNAIIPRSSPHKENQRRPHRSNYTRLRSPDPEEDSSDFFIKTPTNPLASASADEPDEQNHNTVITRRALMAPLSPPQPRTSTGGPRPHSGLMTGSEAPSFMHSTSSSAARSTGRAAMRSSLPSGTNDPSVQPRRRYRPIIIAGEEIPRRSPLMQKLRTNFSRPLTRSKNSAVVDEASGMVEPVEVDADSSIRVNETDMGEIETGMADSFFRSPSQIQGEAESSTLAAELAKELDTAQGDQVEVEKEPSVKERSQSPPEADQVSFLIPFILSLSNLTPLKRSTNPSTQFGGLVVSLHSLTASAPKP